MNEVATIDQQKIKSLKSEVEFYKYLSKTPHPSIIKKNKYANNSSYIPIEHLESFMDSFFPGWSAYIKDYKILGNCVSVSLEIEYTNPLTGITSRRPGVGAVPIELQADKTDKNGNIISNGARHALDFEMIQSKAIHKNLPAAKAYAFKNAVQSIGNIFGRNLNREDVGVFDVYNNETLQKIFA